MVGMKNALTAMGIALPLLFSTTLSIAQTQDQPAAQPTPSPTPAEAKRVTRADLTFGLAYQGPTRLTASATVIWGAPRMFGAWAPGKLIQLRAGARGGQLGLGLVGGAFEDSMFKPSGVGVSLKAIVMRTWRDPTGVNNGHSYAGVESDVILLGFRGSVGYARKVSGQGGPDGRFIWSLGLGL
jgi:hypothetical protein